MSNTPLNAPPSALSNTEEETSSNPIFDNAGGLSHVKQLAQHLSPCSVKAATLYVVATPIGNMADITLHALEVLEKVDVIAAEDTRHSRFLLKNFAINTPMMAVHEHNEKHKAVQIIAKLKQGQSVALIADAGTPLISDPGYHLVSLLRQQGFEVVPIVGACALVGALSVAGLATDHFTFMGFLPVKATQRRQVISNISHHTYTHVFYEAPHRVLACIKDMQDILGDRRRVTVARELTKTYETIKTAPLSEMSVWLATDANQQKGEIVLLVEGYDKNQDSYIINAEAIALMQLLLHELPAKKAASITAKVTPYNKQVLYNWALQNKSIL